MIALGPDRPGPLQLAEAALAIALTAGIRAATASGRLRPAFHLTLGVAAVAVLGFLASGQRL